MMVQDQPGPQGHWQRFRRLMVMVVLVAIGTSGAALAVLYREGVVLRLHFVIALTLAIGVSVLLAGALMGLVFLSATSGHDDAVKRPLDPPRRPRGPWPM